MSKIDSLGISGIRAFRPGNQENMKFSTPLTLIVGHNGSGKTTIIECLKYATTGQLPPNSKGGAFIHDPTLYGGKEVMAQVKLQFRNAGGEKLVCTRSLSCTVKKTTRSMKTVDSSLVIKGEDQRNALTSRNAEMNDHMINQLGVSEAVLDSVIFCHQDESLWPMSEPATLKKKFDEIFEAGKYTKAIDKIKKMKKDQGVFLKTHKAEEKHAKETKDRAEKAEKRSLELQDTIEELRGKVEEATTEINTLEEATDAKLKERRKYAEILSQLQHKKNTKHERERNVEELKNRFEMLHDSDAALESALAQYAERMARCSEEQAEYVAQIDQLEKKIAAHRRDLSRKSTEQGQYVAQQIAHEGHLAERTELVKQSASQHGIRGYEGDLEDYQIREFVDKIQKATKDKKRDLDQVQKTNDEAIRKANAAVNEIEKTRVIRNSEKKAARDTVTANDSKIKDRQQSMGRINVEEENKVLLEDERKKLERDLQNMNSEYADKEWDSNERKLSSRLKELNAETEKLEAEHKKISKDAKERAELEVRKNELKDQQKGLETTSNMYAARLTAAMGAHWKPENVKEEFDYAVAAKQKAVDAAKDLRADTDKERANVDYKLKSDRDALKAKVSQRDSCHEQVVASIDEMTNINDFETDLAEIQDGRDQLKSELDNWSHLKTFYSGCLKSVETKNRCRLCDHEFTGEQEKSAALEKIRKKLLASQVEKLEEDLKTYSEGLNKALAARPLFDTYKRLSEEIPGLREVIKQNEAIRANFVSKLEQQDMFFDEAVANLDELQTLKQPVTNITNHVVQISSLNRKIAELSSQQKVSSSMTIEEIDSQLQGLKEQKNELEKKKDKMFKEERRAKDEINNVGRNLQKAENKLGEVTRELEKKNRFAQEIQECRDANNNLRDAIKKAGDAIEALNTQFEVAKQEFENIRKTCDDKDKKTRDDEADLSMTNTKLQNIESHIKKYIEKGGFTNLAKCKSEVEHIEEELEKVNSEMSRIFNLKQQLEKEKDTGESTKRNIADNIAYRKARKDLQDLAAEIARLESLNADEDNARLRGEEDALRLKSDALKAERQTMMGTMRAKDEELTLLIDEHTTYFKNAGHKYREAHIRVETTKAAIDDLGKYGDALDKAIMKLHSLKMEEINRIAGELWQKTYQGTDVDTILIRSDNETEKANRSYNYRVCMVKQDIEMDMRGRCSAGQRVLASIIIRLALAECFGTNCGIIALDEPTTNLDQDNIRSLAKSLHDIIAVRRAQRNFQLIVITHDEEFLKEMQCGIFADTYFRISRDDEQKSIIRMQSIKEVLG